MARLALLRPNAVERTQRTQVELGVNALVLTSLDGRRRRVVLDGADFVAKDATRSGRFVRHLLVRTAREQIHFITPPEEGSIAPRCAGLPGVPEEVVVISVGDWETAVEWLRGGGRLGGRTVAELARLATAATSPLAVAIGEWAARVASDMTWERGGPMRSAGSIRQALAPLEAAAEESERASEALVAALAYSTLLR